ncbi:hypothetical protein QBC35DRAFT_457492 [Podospora australis]|uniref:Uncharacterized protein n=1 Tax=Podospora australis TaxID=1536484 RepID=A0AAN6WIW1_9PEZI|nr:hypothetical protein QBC35DRAFT_457492 [Podospora australis]
MESRSLLRILSIHLLAIIAHVCGTSVLPAHEVTATSLNPSTATITADVVGDQRSKCESLKPNYNYGRQPVFVVETTEASPFIDDCLQLMKNDDLGAQTQNTGSIPKLRIWCRTSKAA